MLSSLPVDVVDTKAHRLLLGPGVNEVISGLYFSKTQCISSGHCGLNEINLKISHLVK